MPLMSVARNLYLGNEPAGDGLLDVEQMNAERDRAVCAAMASTSTSAARSTRSVPGVQQMIAIVRAVSTDARW